MIPVTSEQALSALAFGVASIRSNPPQNADELNRTRLLISELDAIQVRASRALINQMENVT